jgi:hypothetical protein
VCRCQSFHPLDIPQPVSKQIAVDGSRLDTRHTLFFDRCSIYRRDSFYELHFGFFGEVGELQDGLIVVIAKQILRDVKESFFQYVQQTGGPTSQLPELPPCRIRGDSEVVIADIIGLARPRENEAEILLHAFSWKVAVDRARSQSDPPPLVATCVAILRCELELQKRWIVALYEDED